MNLIEYFLLITLCIIVPSRWPQLICREKQERKNSIVVCPTYMLPPYENITPFYVDVMSAFFSAIPVVSHDDKFPLFKKKAPPNSGRVSRNTFTQLVLAQAENLHFCRATQNWCLFSSLLGAPVKWNFFRVAPFKICQFAFFHNINIKQYINLRSFSTASQIYTWATC